MDTQEITLLINALGSNDDSTRKNAERKLIEILNDDILERLVQSLENSNENARYSIMRLLGASKNPKFAPLLTKTVRRDFAISVRVEALYALGQIGTPEAQKVILYVLVGYDEDVAPYGIDVIVRMKDKADVDQLLNLLPHHRVVAVLGELKEARAIPKLVELLYSQENIGHVAYALSRINGTVIDELLTALNTVESREKRLAIVTALINSSNPKIGDMMFQLLEQALEDDDHAMEYLAVNWIAVRGNGEMHSRILSHPNARVVSLAKSRIAQE